MPSTEPTVPPKISWLIVANLVAAHFGAFVAWMERPPHDLFKATCVGMVLAQLGLLAVWLSLGSGTWWKRLIGVIVGVGYLGYLLGVGISEVSRQTYLIVALATTLVALPLLVARFCKVTIRKDSSPNAPVERIQFSIRDMLILTFVVACLMSLGRLGQLYSLGLGELLELLPFCVAFGFVGVLPVWLVLGTKRPTLSGIGMLALGFGVGCGFGLLSNGQAGIWITATTMEALAMVVSLLVVRSCGYRLVRLRRSPAPLDFPQSP